MDTTIQAPAKLPMPKEGGSYVREGEDLKCVEQTAPTKDKPATEPAAAQAPATPKE